MKIRVLSCCICSPAPLERRLMRHRDHGAPPYTCIRDTQQLNVDNRAGVFVIRSQAVLGPRTLRPKRTGFRFRDIFARHWGVRLVRVKWGLPYLAVSNRDSGCRSPLDARFFPVEEEKEKSEQPPRNHGVSRRRTPSRRLRTNSRTLQNNTPTENCEPGTAYKVK